MVPQGQKIEILGSELLSERKLQGSAMGSNRFRIDMPRLIEFYLAGKLHLDLLISRRMKLEEINEGLEALRKGEVARQVMVF
jgi:S-(hydroxymethyl)glutathione dehydrogenase/alcohol dehydrogenase